MHPQVSYPERCPLCPTPEGYVQKPIPTHKYGDYVILRPDEESSARLERLAGGAERLIREQLKLATGDVLVNSSDRMHLTLAMPLHPLSRDEAYGLLKAIRAEVLSHDMDARPLAFDLVFRGQNDGGSCGFSFTSPNFAPGFDIRLKEPSKAYLGHNKESSLAKMSGLAAKTQAYCEAKGLVSRERNEDGKCNPFNPHISLGKLGSHEVCKSLHNRVQHRTEGAAAMSHLASVMASDAFKCADKSHRHCSVLPLRFKAIEILRVDSDEGEAGKTACLARYDLVKDEMAMASCFPACSHQGEAKDGVPEGLIALFGQMKIAQDLPKVSAASASSATCSQHNALQTIRERINCIILDPIDSGFELRYGTDHKGIPMVDVHFEDKSVAEYILKKVDLGVRETGKVHEVNGMYVVKLGPGRLQTMFGEKGKNIYDQAVAELKARL